MHASSNFYLTWNAKSRYFDFNRKKKCLSQKIRCQGRYLYLTDTDGLSKTHLSIIWILQVITALNHNGRMLLKGHDHIDEATSRCRKCIASLEHCGVLWNPHMCSLLGRGQTYEFDRSLLYLPKILLLLFTHLNTYDALSLVQHKSRSLETFSHCSFPYTEWMGTKIGQ